MRLKDPPSASSAKSVMNQMDVAAQVPATPPPPSTAPTSLRPAPLPPASAPPPAAASAPLPPGGYFAGAPHHPLPPFPASNYAPPSSNYAPPSSSGQVQTPPLPPPPGFPASPPALAFPLPPSIALPGSWYAPPFPPPSVPSPASYYAPQYAPPPAAASQLAQQPHLPSPAATLAYYPTGMIQPGLDGRQCMVYMPCWVYR